ncbi:hypothetical protein BDP27DRAFT_355934 [Rhodocollybia butyracea]|uniref:BTB domain-containing protein n=1 Tax=Rhodocollybia butyracea TaxID=206335 RepID=A0A9P5UBI7_9AGAR|nr:hypothetical protein BDP27DRAFT_69487 [Rhodocollybia butyracea]KAF9073126.1 hypothetical protein BDP27DRAFT_355934 [Rhodocollybia butyracea]
MFVEITLANDVDGFSPLVPDTKDYESPTKATTPFIPSTSLPEAKTEPVTPIQQYPRDYSFYFDHKIFLVEGCLFRIPLNILAAESEVFRDMMNLPAPLDAEGSSDENPILLEDVSQEDFRQLLRVLSPPQKFREPNPNLSFSEWTSVLKLADKYLMDVVKEHAIETMSSLPNIDPVDKIIVANKYNVRAWLIPSFNSILQRSQSLTLHDLDRLGPQTFVRLVGIRDRTRDRIQPNAFGGSVGSRWELLHQRDTTSFDFTGTIEQEILRADAVVPPTSPWGTSRKKKATRGLHVT